MNIKQKVQAYIREQIPELMGLSFGCWVLDRKSNVSRRIAGSNSEDEVLIKSIGAIKKYKLLDIHDFKIIGHPIHLEHYLRVLNDVKISDAWVIDTEGNLFGQCSTDGSPLDAGCKFSLLTGEPASEDDWVKLSEVLGIK